MPLPKLESGFTQGHREMQTDRRKHFWPVASPMILIHSAAIITARNMENIPADIIMKTELADMDSAERTDGFFI